MLLSSYFWFCSVSHLPSIFLHLSLTLSSLSPCQSSDLWLCLSEGHTSLQTLLFVSTPLHFSTLPSSEGNQEPTKINPWLLCARQSCFFFFFLGLLSGLHLLQRNLTAASWCLRRCSDKVPSRPGPLLLLLGAR